MKVIGVEVRCGLRGYEGSSWNQGGVVEAKIIPLEVKFPKRPDTPKYVSPERPYVSITIHTDRGDVNGDIYLPDLDEFGAEVREGERPIDALRREIDRL